MSEGLRFDRLLVNLRFARTRSQSRALIEAGHIRINSKRVTKSSHTVFIGDVVTLMTSGTVTVARIDCLPSRRLAPAEAARGWTALT